MPEFRSDLHDPHTDGFHARGKLPHLKREGGTYFVTFREAGSLPHGVIDSLRLEREATLSKAKAAKRPLTWREERELRHLFSERIDRQLDAGRGPCRLRDPVAADIVANALLHFDGERYELRAWVVMPNHVHAVVWPRQGQTLGVILQGWKSYTAHRIRSGLGLPAGPYWQGESYDHVVRDDEELEHFRRYSVLNPVTAGLCATPEEWQWSSAWKGRAGVAQT